MTDRDLDSLSIADIRASVTDEQRAQIQQEIASGLRCPHGHLDPYADCTPCSRGLSQPPVSGLCYHGRDWTSCSTCASHS